MEENLFEQRIDLSGLSKAVFEIRNEIGQVIIGQHKMVDLILIGLCHFNDPLAALHRK